MFSKLALFALIALASSAPQHQQAAQYPAGVDPSTCPNFPICDNAQLHGPKQWNAQPQQWNAQPQHNQWNPQPQQWNAQPQQWNAQPQQWNAQPQHNQWNPQPQQWNAQPQSWNAAPALHGPATNALPEQYPAGVNPQQCPNYPFCDVNGGQGHAAAPPLPGFTERLYPAGVSAHECPNFPYCN